MNGLFLTDETTAIESFPHGLHTWLSRRDLTRSDDLLITRVDMPAGQGHSFHKHPLMDEVIYILSGEAEQWIETEKRTVKAGEGAFIGKDIVHATFNVSDKPLSFLAILAPSAPVGQELVDVSGLEPWKSIR